MDAVPNTSDSTERFALPRLSPSVRQTCEQQLRVVFGRLKLTTQELEKLEVGHVRELMEAADAPVEVLRDDILVARAVPVEQDGQLAWRVIEVLEESPQSREVTS